MATDLVDETEVDETETTQEVSNESSEPTAEQALLAEIKSKQQEVDAAKASMEFAKEELKELKATWEMRVAELGNIIRRNPENMPLFDGDKAPVNESPEAWRAVPVGELSLGTRATNALLAAEVETAGQLDDARAADGGLTSIKGVGQALADSIEEMFLNWLDRQHDESAEADAE